MQWGRIAKDGAGPLSMQYCDAQHPMRDTQRRVHHAATQPHREAALPAFAHRGKVEGQPNGAGATEEEVAATPADRVERTMQQDIYPRGAMRPTARSVQREACSMQHARPVPLEMRRTVQGGTTWAVARTR